MTRQELLTKLAMKLSEWPSPQNHYPTDTHIRFNGYPWVFLNAWYIEVPAQPPITRADYLAERERLINKPGWGEAPKWATHIGQQADGWWIGLEDPGDIIKGCGSAFWEAGKTKRICHGTIPAGHDWRETLEPRPTENKETGVIYAIGPNKEHRICKHCASTGMVYTSGSERIVEADAEGWIPWDGASDDSPLPQGSECDISLSHGVGEVSRILAEDWSWSRGGDQHIVAYRPILDQQEPEAPEWDGKGLPPEGTVCEMESLIPGMWEGQWLTVRIVAVEGDIAIGWCEEKQIAIWNTIAIRPLRSEEDKAVEEITRLLMSLPIATAAYGDTARALYHAGLRFPEE